MSEVPTRAAAVGGLETDHARIRGLIEPLSSADFTRSATIGGGEWSAKDLVGHLTSWEEHALGALEAWSRGETAPIQLALAERGVDAINAETVAADARRSESEVRARFDAIHRRLVAQMDALSPEAWTSRPPGAEIPRAEALGGVLGAPDAYFAHVDAHIGDLEAFVRSL